MPTQEIQLIAPFKINLSLHIVGQRPNGYHLLDGITVFTHHGDELIIEVHDKPHDIMSVFGLDANILNQNPQENLVHKGLNKLRELNYDIPFLNIRLNKIIPSQAGYGGGSSNVATVLKWANNYFNLGISENDLSKIGLSLGADVPMCLYGKPCHIKGIGEIISPISLVNIRYYCLLVKPKHSLSTPLIFKNLANKNNPPLNLADNMIEQSFKCGRNDLLKPSLKLLPEIQHYLEILKQTNPIFCSMSGSGSGLFSLYKDESSLEKAYDLIDNKGLENFFLKTWIDV